MAQAIDGYLRIGSHSYLNHSPGATILGENQSKGYEFASLTCIFFILETTSHLIWGQCGRGPWVFFAPLPSEVPPRLRSALGYLGSVKKRIPFTQLYKLYLGCNNLDTAHPKKAGEIPIPIPSWIQHWGPSNCFFGGCMLELRYTFCLVIFFFNQKNCDPFAPFCSHCSATFVAQQLHLGREKPWPMWQKM